MNGYFKVNEWSVIEEGFKPSYQESSESIFSLGNGSMGQRGNFEEKYSGETFQGNYIAGVYFPDKTRVGWWKIGYPDYYAKVLNAPNWIGIHVDVNNEELDLNTITPINFRRELNMRNGFLERSFQATMTGGEKISVNATRFLSMHDEEIGAIRYSIKAENTDISIKIFPHINGDVRNRDSNFNEVFWNIISKGAEANNAFLHSRTRRSGFDVCMAMNVGLSLNDKPVQIEPIPIIEEKLVGQIYVFNLLKGDTLSLYKFVSVCSSMNHAIENIKINSLNKVKKAKDKGFLQLLDEHKKVWEAKWSHSDVVIEGDLAAQQGIRFNIFQLNQTYTGKDPRLNIGPKGFTGEKYGGSTYWDTEAFLIPFYLSTAPTEVARNLLIYRYNHLNKAIENAQRLGFQNGAALYPMVTMNGEESHNEWEVAFEEIHRNGAIAYAIYNYVRYTNDNDYLAEYGLEVLIAISRFWRQRVNWSDVKGKYVILGVTGPNEYENNINNNWYTNKLAVWTLEYTISSLEEVLENNPLRHSEIIKKVNLDYDKEINSWKDIIHYMYFPIAENPDIFLQQEGYLDKEQKFVSEIHESERPLNQHWSWDRILRSCFIKQADVVQGLYIFEDEFDLETIRSNFNYYEPRTVHESSLSPCIHSIIASKLGYIEKAYELFLRTSRLDLDDYNCELHEGLHITSMGGTWMAIVHGFAGLRIKNGKIHLNPALPPDWKSISFRVIFRGNTLRINISGKKIDIIKEDGPGDEVFLRGKKMIVH
jgi:maltose phosphorylase